MVTTESFLKNGNRVVCLDNFATGKRENVHELTKDRNFTLIEGDICDYDTCFKANVSIVQFDNKGSLMIVIPK